MAKVIKLRKGLDINLKGKAAAEIATVKCPGEYALCPDDFYGVKPKVVVKEGDAVKVGDALFVDKLHPEVKFVSPVSGTVSMVERGDRRKLLSIRVKSDAKQEARTFDTKDVKAALLESGLFAFFRQRPYDVVANPEDKPKAIYVSAFNSMPLSQDFEVALRGNEAEFQAGISALAKLAPVRLGVSSKQTAKALLDAQDCTVTVFKGKAPAGNVGVQINHTDPINKGEIVWTLGAEEVIFVGRLMTSGKVDLTRVVALAGSEVQVPKYYKVLVGQQLTTLLEGNVRLDGSRVINGNVMTGIKTTKDAYLAAHATEINVIPEGDHADEMLGWIMPRFGTFSTHRSYFSWLCGKKEYTIDARIKGGERHMIMSGEYDKVFPMDIYAGYLVKAIIAGDIDRQEALGIYEVAPEDFAIAEFVDSSKLELQRIVRQGLDILRKENA
ncbi:MAG: Na(+)-translocating NADH-quinone reductase subunit A [Bacteroidaceae bacterium]|jgi:Na+-transporting NADH:ubiquinone oxidoreductase subunit A|nr:Na(+)-translocating NADH-quinone reductase subunit A [Bacteroidaceae bacterium]MBR6846188.1 Na(+)-translocating NADH-quinone reductase subunit A [Bacteroidaceae bacterium]